MPQEECKEKILSEEYRDFMMRDTGALGENFPLENGCRIPLKYGFELLYIDQSEDRKKPLGDYPYTMVPKCYIRGNKSIWRSRARIQRKPFRHLIRTDMALLLQVWHAEGQIRRICLSGQRRRQRW